MDAKTACIRRRKRSKRFRHLSLIFANTCIIIIVFTVGAAILLSDPQEEHERSLVSAFFSKAQEATTETTEAPSMIINCLISWLTSIVFDLYESNIGDTVFAAVYGLSLVFEIAGIIGIVVLQLLVFVEVFPTSPVRSALVVLILIVGEAYYVALRRSIKSARRHRILAHCQRGIIGAGLTVVFSPIAYIAGFFWKGLLPMTLNFFFTVRYKLSRKRDSLKMKTNFLTVVNNIWNDADRQGYSFYYEAKKLFRLKELLYSKANVFIDRNQEGNDLLKDWEVSCFALADSTSIELSRSFFRNVEEIVNGHGLIGNAYRLAAAEQFEPSIRSVVKRGLSSVLPCDDLEGACKLFRSDLENRGCDRKIPEEENVIYIAVSYRYERKDGLSDQNWKEVIQMTADIARNLGYSKMRLWVDRIAVKMHMPWASIGFLPYLIYPTFVHRNAKGFTNRIWIELEKLAASLGPGILALEQTEDSLMKHLLLSRSPTESILAFAEVLVSECTNKYEITFERDKNYMRRWAESVLTTTEVTQVFTMPRYDLEGRGHLRHDVSMLCLHDYDIACCPAIKSYKREEERGSPRGSFYTKDAGSRWDGVAELFEDNYIRNSEEVRSKITSSAVVLHTPYPTRRTSLCWFIVETMRGRMIIEVFVEQDGDVREGVIKNCRILRLHDQLSGKVHTVRELFLGSNALYNNHIQYRGKLNRQIQEIPYQEVCWTWGHPDEALSQYDGGVTYYAIGEKLTTIGVGARYYPARS